MSDVETFIREFVDFSGSTDETSVLLTQFRSGYCWHFAHMLQTAFGRGTVVWFAPFGHFAFWDSDGRVYDIEGEYHGEAFWFIPEEHLGPALADFTQAGKSFCASQEYIVGCMQRFCRDTGVPYDPGCEIFFLKRRASCCGKLFSLFLLPLLILIA